MYGNCLGLVLADNALYMVGAEYGPGCSCWSRSSKRRGLEAGIQEALRRLWRDVDRVGGALVISDVTSQVW